jgi:uncharacterized membrane protein YkoI
MRRLSRLIAATFLIATLVPVAGSAAQKTPRGCLSPVQQKAVIKSGRAITLARTLAIVRKRAAGDVLRAQLCRERSGLVYVVTVITRNGKVVRVRVNAASGSVIGKR